MPEKIMIDEESVMHYFRNKFMVPYMEIQVAIEKLNHSKEGIDRMFAEFKAEVAKANSHVE